MITFNTFFLTSGGLQPGDIVISINGVPVNNATDIYTSLENTSGPLSLQIARGRVKKTITITPEVH